MRNKHMIVIFSWIRIKSGVTSEKKMVSAPCPQAPLGDLSVAVLLCFSVGVLICGVCFVIICSSFLLLLLSDEGCASGC